MKNLIITICLIFGFIAGLEAQTLSAAKMRTATTPRASQFMLDTLDDADSTLYIFPGLTTPFVTEFHFKWTSISGTLRDTVTISFEPERAYRLNTTNATTIATAAVYPGYIQKAQFVLGATGLIGGVKDTIFSLSCNGAGNIKVYHKSTGTQSTIVQGHAKKYAAANGRAQ